MNLQSMLKLVFITLLGAEGGMDKISSYDDRMIGEGSEYSTNGAHNQDSEACGLESSENWWDVLAKSTKGEEDKAWIMTSNRCSNLS